MNFWVKFIKNNSNICVCYDKIYHIGSSIVWIGKVKVGRV